MAFRESVSGLLDQKEFPLLTRHPSWQCVELRLIAEIQNGFPFPSAKFSKSRGMPLIRIRDIGNSDTQDLFDGPYDQDFMVSRGDLLIGMDGDFNLAEWKSEEGLLNQRVCRIRNISALYSKNFLKFCLPAFLSAINSRTSSVTVKHLSSRTIEEIPLPLPPLAEQARIVAKIEELFSSLDKGVESLKTAKEQLKVYRQAVLKWAFEGKCLGANPEKDRPLRRIGNFCKVVRGGSPRPAGDKRYYDGDIPFLKVADITRDQRMFVQKSEYTIKAAGLKKTRRIPPNTLLLSNSGATLGVPKICTISATMNDGIAAFIGLPHDALKFYYYFWQGKTEELRAINQGAAQPNLNTQIIGNVEIAIFSPSEQEAIVSHIESRFSACDKLEEAIDQGLAQAEALRQSILKRAFEGKLVPQDPNDEPASVLLERIRAEREAAGETATRRRMAPAARASDPAESATRGPRLKPLQSTGAAKTRRGPGRPRKTKATKVQSQKRGPGRPRKHKES